MLRELRDALLAGGLVVGDAARLLWRHWPALVTIFLLGLAVRNSAMWAAVLLGRDHPVLASLLVPLAPLAIVIALVLMLRQAARSARWGTLEEGTTGAEKVGVLASALVPFLTVYSLQGDLDEDRHQFINESYADSFSNTDFFAGAPLAARTIATETTWQLWLIGIALVLRVVIAQFRLAERHPAGAVLAALVEVTWLTWLASILTSRWLDLRDWAAGRVVVAETQDAWHQVTATFGPLTDPVRELGALVATIVDDVGALVVVPVAWLAVGSVVLAGGLSESRRARLEQHAVVGGVVTVAVDRTRRHLGERAVDLLGRRFEDLVAGLRTIAHAGLLPVLVFCLVLMLGQAAEWGAAEVLRALLGPRESETMLFFSPYLDLVTRTVYTVVVVALIAAAVDRLLARPLAEEAASAQRAPGYSSSGSTSTST